MRRRWSALVVVALLAAACSSSSALRTRERVELDEGTLRAGMGEDDAVALLGRPDHRGQGAGGACRYAARFYDVRPDRETIELSWRRPDRIIVAYLRGPIVTSVGVIPTP